MSTRPILIVWGEPNSIFSEILLKSFRKYKSKKPIILIGSKNLFIKQIKKLNVKFNINLINMIGRDLKDMKINKINFINVEYRFTKPFEKITSKSNNYIFNCFKKAIDIISENKVSGLINGPISKKSFLKKKFLGITEFLSKKFKVKDNYTMLLYGKSLSVSPITTHLPISKVSNHLKKESIILKTTLINNFYKKFLSLKPRIGVCGLNPHCENFYNKSEENLIITPAIKHLKKKQIKINGPIPADTIFTKNIRNDYDVIIGMYHDQVLAPIKSIYGFAAINITLGLPFIRISPDHGPNFNMIGKNKSNPESLINSIKFLNKVN
jgi:4-hydroxythreonine-4-phosphate dehydrogenase